MQSTPSVPTCSALLATLLLSPVAVRAQPAGLVADIQAPGATLFPNAWLEGYQMTDFVPVNGVVVMALDDTEHGTELWVSDGTPAGSHLLRDICPGSCSSRPTGLTVGGGAVYLTADDGAHGSELWRTDGTPAGTSLVADLLPGLRSSAPEALAAAGGLLYFSARLPAGGLGLWRSDGTSAGTFPLTIASADPSATATTVVLGASAGGVVFAFNDGTHGLEPWVTDGSVPGTGLLLDVAPGVADSLALGGPFRGVSTPVQLNGRALFAADDGVHGRELWASDGTAAGTVLVLDIQPGTSESNPERLMVSGGRAYFAANDAVAGREVWASDGTAAGTHLLVDATPGADSSVVWRISPFASGILINLGTAISGSELWRSDGTPEGTTLVKSMPPAPDGGWAILSLDGCYQVGERAYFLANDGLHGVEPWVTDGTEAGTNMLVDISTEGTPNEPGAWSASLFYGVFDRPATLADRLLFRIFRGHRRNELWATDGTPGGTSLVTVISAGGSSVVTRVQEEMLIGGPLGVADDAILFAGDDGSTGSELWRSDGTAVHTSLLADLDPQSQGGSPVASTPRSFVSVGRRSLFSYWTLEAGGSSLPWIGITDGTVEGTSELIQGANGVIDSAVALGGEVVFSAGDGLVRTDGTAGGTQAVPCACGAASDLIGIGGKVVFAAYSTLGWPDNEPWAYDPSTHTTTLLGDLVAGSAGSMPDFLGEAGSLALFSANLPATGRELWRTDGTPAGTGPVADLATGSSSGLGVPSSYRERYGTRAATLAGSLAFAADDGVHGEELWSSNGSAAGTAQVLDLRPGALPSEPRWLTPLGSRVLFAADDGVHGRELWASDGTAAGTALLGDLWPGPESGQPQRLTVVDGVVLFAATDGVHGLELWRTDGTPAGTVPVQDLAPGLAASSPLAITRVGPEVFFLAADPAHGFELWHLSLDRLSNLELFRDDLETGVATRWSVATP